MVAGLSVPAHAGLTLVTRETMQGIGTLDSGSPGNLGTVTGTFAKRPVGPRITGDTTASGLGWSGDLRPSGYGVRSIASLNFHMASQWVYLPGIPNTGYNTALIYSDVYPHGYQFLSLFQLTNGHFGYIAQNDTTYPAPTDTGITMPLFTWIEVRAAWRQVRSGVYQKGLYYRVAGASSFTALFEDPADGTPNEYGDSLDALWLGLFDSDQNGPAGPGRIGMPSVYAMTEWADRLTLIPDVVDPPAGPFAWYCNPATGNDANDGTTASTAWASTAQINAESQYLGMMPGTAGQGSGDTLTIDGSVAPLELGGLALQIQTRALKVNLIGAEPIKAWKDISAASTTWTLADGATDTYQTTDDSATDLTGVVVWENDEWLYHATGTSASASTTFYNTAGVGTAYSTVLAALDANAGSFYVDSSVTPAVIYLHPTGDTNPASDGKTYTRSRYRTGNGSIGSSAVLIQAPDVWVAGDAASGQVVNYPDRFGAVQSFRASKLWKTCLAEPSTNDPYNGYGIQWDSGSGGNCKVTNFWVDYFSKHGLGRTATATNMNVTRQNVFYGQGSLYVGYGGQTQDVDFVGDGSTGNSWTYLNCASVVNVGVIGSATGAVTDAQPSWLSHAGAANNFTGGTWTNCSLCGAITGLNGTVGPITITGTLFGGGEFGCTTNIDQSRTTLVPVTLQIAGQTLTVTNSILGVMALTNGNSFTQLTGALVLRGVDVDLRGNVSAGNGQAVWSKLNSASVTLQNVLFLSDPGKDFTLLGDFGPSDTITTDHDAYDLGPSGLVVSRWNGGAGLTLTQWQTLGEDADSFVTSAAAAIDAGFNPVPGSPLGDGGANLGSGADYTGATFAHRTTIGADEAPPDTFAQWQNAYFTDDQLNDPTVSDDLADPAGDGVVNLLKYAFGLDPGNVASPASLPVVSFDGTNVVMTYSQSLWAGDLTYTVEQSVDLAHWTASTPASTVLGSGGGCEQIEAAVPAAGNGRLFLRLRVSRQ